MASTYPVPAFDLPCLGSKLLPASTCDQICGDAFIPAYEKEETAVLLVLAHFSGWSAERIANAVNERFYTEINAEAVWEMCVSWANLHANGSKKEVQDVFDPIRRDILAILNEFGLEDALTTKRLHQTPRLVSIPYVRAWYPEGRDNYKLFDGLPNPPLFDGFDNETQRRCINRLSWRARESTLAEPVPDEQNILRQLGPYVESISRKLISQWLVDAKQQTENMPFSRTIGENIELWSGIASYASAFKREWEAEFGEMDDDPEVLYLGKLEAATSATIRSTGAAAKIFFCLMLANRLKSLNIRQKTWREMTGFVELDIHDLPDDAKHCLVCRDRLGEANELGEIETPIQVVACCGNIFGKPCLQKWYGECIGAKCPLCKADVASSLLDKLLDDPDREHRIWLERERRLRIDLDAWDSGIIPDEPESSSIGASHSNEIRGGGDSQGQSIDKDVEEERDG